MIYILMYLDLVYISFVHEHTLVQTQQHLYMWYQKDYIIDAHIYTA